VIIAATPSVMSSLAAAHLGNVRVDGAERVDQHAGGLEFARGSPITIRRGLIIDLERTRTQRKRIDAIDPIRTSQPPLRASTCQSGITPFRPNGVTAYLSNRDTLESGRSFMRSMHHSRCIR